MDCVKVKIEQHQIVDDVDDKIFFDGKAILKIIMCKCGC